MSESKFKAGDIVTSSKPYGSYDYYTAGLIKGRIIAISRPPITITVKAIEVDKKKFKGKANMILKSIYPSELEFFLKEVDDVDIFSYE